jgi:quercetin dioxygenase-like cupin family protein
VSRPHIEFIQQQDLPFQPAQMGPAVGSESEVGIKVLSLDPESRASSGLVEIPPSWRLPGTHHFLVDIEMYVLSGELTVSGVSYTQHTYCFLPAGYTVAGGLSERGALVMLFTSGWAELVPGEAAPGLLNEQRLIRYLNLFEGPWTGNFHPQFPVGAGRKWLRRDPVTTDESWILGTLALRNGRKPEKHPVVEEMYLLAGELIGPQGLMRPGAYFWRPPEVWHGPYGSKTGCLMLFRTVGGPLSTVYTEEEQDFDWDPEGYHPILPPELAHLKK